MRPGSLSLSLIAAILLHAVAAYGIGVLLAAVDSDEIIPEFRQGLTSVEPNLVEVSVPVPAVFEPVPEPIPVDPIVKPAPAPKPEKVEEPPVEVDTRQQGVVEGVKEALADVSPRYPLGSRIRGEEGVVKIKIVIDGAGRAASAEVVETSGFGALDSAGLKAAKKARFHDMHGVPVKDTETTVTFRFKLID